MRLSGRTALITGASRGIGRAIALAFAREGADVAINYAGNRELAEAAVAEITALGRRAKAYQANVADASAVNTMCAAAIADFGQLDILINNAGIGSSAVNRPTIVDGTLEQYELLIGANLWGPIHLCRALVPHLRGAARSDVIMISSVAVQSMGPRMGLYSIGKAGMEALAHTLAKEERAHGMRVNIVAPGLVDTDMGRKLLGLLTGSDDMRARDPQSPFGFVCSPDDIAETVLWLCSEQGRYITNERITVSGGNF